MRDRFAIPLLLRYLIINRLRGDRFSLLASSSSLYISVSIHSRLAIPGFSRVLVNLLEVPSSRYSRGHPRALHLYECPFSVCCGGSLSPRLRGLDTKAQCEVKDGRVLTTQAGGGQKHNSEEKQISPAGEKTRDSSWSGRKARVGGLRKTKNASCSELGDENVSCSEHRGSQLRGVEGTLCAGSSQSVRSEL